MHLKTYAAKKLAQLLDGKRNKLASGHVEDSWVKL